MIFGELQKRPLNFRQYNMAMLSCGGECRHVFFEAITIGDIVLRASFSIAEDNYSETSNLQCFQTIIRYATHPSSGTRDHRPVLPKSPCTDRQKPSGSFSFWRK